MYSYFYQILSCSFSIQHIHSHICTGMQYIHTYNTYISTYIRYSVIIIALQEDRRKIEKITSHAHFKKLVPPSIEEGFDEVYEIDWVPQSPTNPVSARLFNMYLT